MYVRETTSRGQKGTMGICSLEEEKGKTGKGDWEGQFVPKVHVACM